MAALDPGRLAPGYDDPVQATQRVFRAALEALSHPGRVTELPPPPGDGPGRLAPAAAALALTLLDADTRVWLSPALDAGTVRGWLRFHTGAPLVARPAQCDFAFVGEFDELPGFSEFPRGSDEAPERSATLVLQVPALAPGGGWVLRGPGIAGQARLSAGLAAVQADEFRARWRENRAVFPRGLDCFLAAGVRLAGLPRTTRLEEA